MKKTGLPARKRLRVTLALLAAVLLTAGTASAARIKNYTVVNKTGYPINYLEYVTEVNFEKGGQAFTDGRTRVFGAKIPDGQEIKFDYPTLPDEDIRMSAERANDEGRAVGIRWEWILRPKEGMTLTLYRDGKYSVD
jgi:hypothetical protein